MKKTILFLFILLSSANAFTSKYILDINISEVNCDQVIHKLKYDICYSYRRKTPILTAYDITAQQLKGRKYKRLKNFKADYSVPRKYRSYESNYVHEGYDKGHNCPNAAFDHNKKLQKQTFIMSNVAPQAKWLNRKYWAKVERFARFEAMKYGKVEVVTGSCGNKGYIKNRVVIPQWWFKIIYIPKLKKTVAFLAPNINKGMKTANIKKYLSTVEQIKKVCKF